MAVYTITLTVDAPQPASVEKKLRAAFGDNVPVHTVEKLKTAASRASRLSDAQSLVDDAKAIVEELKGEMQEWQESIPENLQSGEKAGEVQEAIDALESLEGDLDNLSFDDVSFPSAF